MNARPGAGWLTTVATTRAAQVRGRRVAQCELPDVVEGVDTGPHLSHAGGARHRPGRRAGPQRYRVQPVPGGTDLARDGRHLLGDQLAPRGQVVAALGLVRPALVGHDAGQRDAVELGNLVGERRGLRRA